jgi:hypothetical protein
MPRSSTATADRTDLARADRRHFFAIRLEPYLVATARAHPDLRRAFALVETTRGTKRVLVQRFQPQDLLPVVARSFSTLNARGTAIRRSTWRSC